MFPLSMKHCWQALPSLPSLGCSLLLGALEGDRRAAVTAVAVQWWFPEGLLVPLWLQVGV